MKMSIVFLVASLLMAIGGWILTLPDWHAALLPVSMGGLLTGMGGVILSWLGKSPIGRNDQTK